MSTSLFEAKHDRRRAFKKGIDGDDSRRKREDGLIELRKQKREENLAKKRTQLTGGASPAPATTLPPGGTTIIPELFRGIMTEEPTVQYESTMQFRKLLSIERNPPIQEVINSGAVPRLVEFLKREENTKLQFEAAWALTNIASGTSTHTQVVMQHQAVPIFVTLLRSHSDEVREQAVWALGNIAGDSPDCRDLVLKTGALQPLLVLCNPQSGQKLTMMRNATWTLSNLCRGKPQPEFAAVKDALPVLSELLFIKDEEVLTDACWALSYLSDDTGPNNEKIQAVIESGSCKRLVDILVSDKSNTVKTPALRTLGNIVTGDDLQTQIVINSGALEALQALLGNEKKGIRKEACWTISNITAGNPEQIEAVMKHLLIPPLVEMLASAQFDIKKEAAWAISNATSGGTDEQIRFLVRCNVIPPLADLFICADVKIIMVALEGIENILRVGKQDAESAGGGVKGTNLYADAVEECGGMEKLEQIQNHQNIDIYNKSVEIITTYFQDEDDREETEGMAPQQADGMFQFGQPGAEGADQTAFNF